jgi:hypothetical protein
MTHACNTAGASTRITPNRWDSSWPVFVTEPERRAILGYFEDRFGIPLRAFETYHVLERRHGYVVLPKSARVEDIASFKVQNTGLPILRKMLHHLKPTTAALQRFGTHATRHVVDLTPAEMNVLLREQESHVPMALQPGYVLLRCEGHLLGCGIYTPGRLRSLIPLRQVKHQHLPESAPGIETRAP